jgi:hypothetical protein
VQPAAVTINPIKVELHRPTLDRTVTVTSTEIGTRTHRETPGKASSTKSEVDALSISRIDERRVHKVIQISHNSPELVCLRSSSAPHTKEEETPFDRDVMPETGSGEKFSQNIGANKTYFENDAISNTLNAFILLIAILLRYLHLKYFTACGA